MRRWIYWTAVSAARSDSWVGFGKTGTWLSLLKVARRSAWLVHRNRLMCSSVAGSVDRAGESARAVRARCRQWPVIGRFGWPRCEEELGQVCGYPSEYRQQGG